MTLEWTQHSDEDDDWIIAYECDDDGKRNLGAWISSTVTMEARL